MRESKYEVIGTEVIYEGSHVLATADSATFESLADAEYGKDGHAVYILGHTIPGADPKSFRVIRSPYSRDNRRVYCGNVPMDVADLDSFELVRESWTWGTAFMKESFCLEFGNAFDAIEVSDESPAVVGHAWASDGQFYYYGPARVQGADYETFEVIDDQTAKDKYHAYNGNHRDTSTPLPASQPAPATFP